jgi:hypothetical protein
LLARRRDRSVRPGAAGWCSGSSVPSPGSAGRTAAVSGPSVSVRPPSSFVLGDRAVISGRAAAWLTSRAGLAELRARVRGDDPEIDEALLSLAVAGAAWRASFGGTVPAPQGEPAAGFTTSCMVSGGRSLTWPGRVRSPDRAGRQSSRSAVEQVWSEGSFLAGDESGDRGQDGVEGVPSAEVASEGRRFFRCLMPCSTRIRQEVTS